jgi:hypothetical protein
MRCKLFPTASLPREIGTHRIEILGHALPQREQWLALGEQPVALLDKIANAGFHAKFSCSLPSRKELNLPKPENARLILSR